MSSRPRSRSTSADAATGLHAERVRAAAALAAGLAGLHALRWASLDYAMDDAWIVARVARTLWQSGVPTYDLSLPPTESVSDPLWTALAVPLVAIGLDPVAPLRWLGGLCWVVLVAGASVWSAKRAGVLGAVITGGVLAATGGLAYHAVSGLETASWALLVVASAAWAAGSLPAWAGALALVGVAWSRPEAPWVLVGVAALAGRPRWPVGVGVMAWLALLGARLWLYGDVVPNTAYAKPPDVWAGLAYVGDGWLALGVLAPLVAARHEPRLIGFAAWLALGVVISGGDWMPAHRRLMEVAVIVAVGLGAAAQTRLGALAALLWLAACGRSAWTGSDGSAWYHGDLAAVGERAAAADIDRIAAFDVGRLGWTFPGSVHDLAGLTDPHIARLPGSHGQKPFDASWFDARAPDWVVLTTLNDPTLAEPQLINAEAAVWDHIGDTWAIVWVEPVGDPDHLLVLARPADAP